MSKWKWVGWLISFVAGVAAVLLGKRKSKKPPAAPTRAKIELVGRVHAAEEATARARADTELARNSSESFDERYARILEQSKSRTADKTEG